MGGGGGGGGPLVVTEAGAGAMVVLARRGFWGPELSLARRPGGEGRFALSAAGGDYDGVVGMRVQATAQLLLRPGDRTGLGPYRSEEHTSELQSQSNLVCRLLLEKKKN